MAKTFTADIGTVNYPKTPMTVPTADTGKGELATRLVGLAIDTDKKLSESRLIGDEDINKPLVVGGLEVSQDTKIPENDAVKLAQEVEGELNLRKIKRMREQGILSHSGAKILAASAVQSASARRPGMAADFRKTAATFFGDFGEGQGILDPTEQERASADMLKKVQGLMVSAGFYTPSPTTGMPQFSSQDYENFQKISRSITNLDFQKKTFEAAVDAGKASAMQLDSLGRHYSNNETMSLLGSIQGEIARTGAVMKPEVIANRLAMSKTKVHNTIDKEIAAKIRNGVVLTSDQIAAIHKAADEDFKNTEDFMKTQTFSTLMKDKRQAMTDFIATQGLAAFPTLALAEAAAPGSAKDVLELSNKIKDMSPNQVAHLFELNPTLKQYWDAVQGAQLMSGAVTNVLKGIFPDKLSDITGYNAALFASSSMAKNSNGLDDPNTQSAIGALVQQANKGDTNAIYALADNTVKANTTPEGKAAFARSVANESANLAISIPQALLDHPDYEIVFDGEMFVPQLTSAGQSKYSRETKASNKWVVAPGMAGVPQELKQGAASLNTIMRALKNYGGDPAFEAGFAADPFFKEKFGGRGPTEIATSVLDLIKQNKSKIRDYREGRLVTPEQKKAEERRKLKEAGVMTE